MIPTEPNADMRLAARTAWQAYSAFIEQGFTEQQALYLVGEMLTSTGGGT